MGDNTEMGTIPRFVGIDGRTKPAAADMSAAFWAGWTLLPAFEAVTGALVTASSSCGGSARPNEQPSDKAL